MDFKKELSRLQDAIVFNDELYRHTEREITKRLESLIEKQGSLTNTYPIGMRDNLVRTNEYNLGRLECLVEVYSLMRACFLRSTLKAE